MDEISEEYLRFDDNYFWKALRDMVDNHLACFAQKAIVSFCMLLLSHKGLDMINGSEIRFESDNAEDAREGVETKKEEEIAARLSDAEEKGAERERKAAFKPR